MVQCEKQGVYLTPDMYVVKLLVGAVDSTCVPSSYTLPHSAFVTCRAGTTARTTTIPLSRRPKAATPPA